MSGKIQILEKLVGELYGSKNPNRADWADWLYQNHVLWVASKIEELARRFNADPELSRAAALLHDIADATMKRDNSEHEAESLKIARDLMAKADFSQDDIMLVVDDAIRYHSCHGEEQPHSLEGKCLSTADALAHLQSNFYPFAIKFLGGKEPLEVINEWASAKLDRDYHNKILFEEVKAEVEPEYKVLKQIFQI